jgi:hypothetical protein
MGRSDLLPVRGSLCAQGKRTEYCTVSVTAALPAPHLSSFHSCHLTPSLVPSQYLSVPRVALVSPHLVPARVASRPLLFPQYGILFLCGLALCGYLMSAIVCSSRYALLCGFPFSFTTSGLRVGLRAVPVTLIFISSLLWRARASHEAYLRCTRLPFFSYLQPLFPQYCVLVSDSFSIVTTSERLYALLMSRQVRRVTSMPVLYAHMSATRTYASRRI